MKLSDLEKIENILKNLKSKTEDQVKEAFKDFNIDLTRMEKVLLMIPGINIFINKKIEKRFYNIFKNKDISYIKSDYSFLFEVDEWINSIGIFNTINIIIVISLLCVEGLNTINILFFSFVIGLHYFLCIENKNFSELFEKDELMQAVLQNTYFTNFNNTINKEDFDELQKYIDKESLKKLLVDNNFNISYKALKMFIEEKKNRVKNEDKYLKAEEILLSKEKVYL